MSGTPKPTHVKDQENQRKFRKGVTGFTYCGYDEGKFPDSQVISKAGAKARAKKGKADTLCKRCRKSLGI